MKSDLIAKGEALQAQIRSTMRDLNALARIQSIRLGIVKVQSDALPKPTPPGMTLFHLPEPEKGSDFTYVCTNAASYEEAAALWLAYCQALEPMKLRHARMLDSLKEIDMMVRDLAGAEQQTNGLWCLRGQHGEILADSRKFGQPIHDFETLRRFAYRFIQHAFSPSPFSLLNQ